MSEGLKDFAAGCIGGFAGKLLDYPLDTIKVLLQTQNMTMETTAVKPTAVAGATAVANKPPPLVYNGAWHCFRHTVDTKGFLSLYKGISSPLLGSMAENAVLFLCYSSVKRALGEQPGVKELSLTQLCLSGAIAGGVVSFVLTPVELVKCRLQVQNSSASGFTTYKGPIDVITQTLKTEGLVQGLYRGHLSMMLREIPGNFCWYGTYEGVCLALTPEGGSKADLGMSAHLMGGAAAGVAYWTAFYPADTIKSQIQTHPLHRNRGFLEMFAMIWKAEGIRGLYRGWGVTVLRAAPAHAAIFAAYEYTLKWLRPTPDHDKMMTFTMHESIRD